jgi:hypothetical protein
MTLEVNDAGAPTLRRAWSSFYEWRRTRGGWGSGAEVMPVMIVSADAGKTVDGRGSNVVLCAGKAGTVQQEETMQLGASPLSCLSPSQPGQRAPLLIPTGAAPCICVAIAALDAT